MRLDENEISKLAYDAEPPESALSYEWLLWYRLRDIYARVRTGELSEERGRKAKRDAVNTFHAEREAFEREAQFWRKIESAAIAYAKAAVHTPEADAFYTAVYGVRPGIGTAGNTKEEA